jgi:hypothetical protein
MRSLLAVSVCSIVLGCASGRVASTTLPDLRAMSGGCAEPTPRFALVQRDSGGMSPGTLRVDVRSTVWPDWRGDVQLVLLGPLEASPALRRMTSHDADFEITGIDAGRYVVRVVALAHYGRVDTIVVPPRGLQVLARVDAHPSHYCRMTGTVIVPPR